MLCGSSDGCTTPQHTILLKDAAGRTLCVAGYAKDAIVGTCHRTIDGQEHIVWLAGPEQDTIFHLRVTAYREQGSHCHDERLAWVASWGQGTLCSN